MSANVTEAILLEGKKVGEKLREELHQEVASIKTRDGVSLRLACVMVGKDPAADFYRRAQERGAKSLGIEFDSVLFEETVSEKEVAYRIEELSRLDSGVHGIIIQMPLPKQVDIARLYPRLNPLKDVEGIHPETLGFLMMRRAKLIPATPLACMTLLDSIGYECRGKEAVIIGQSAIVGRPLQLLLGERRATTIVCNTGTPAERIAFYVKQADLVLACAGKPGTVPGEWIKDGAVVIDVGTTEVEGKLVGDVGFEEAKKRAKYITPVPGGVGPLTVLMLMKNLIQAYRWQKEILHPE